MKIRDVWHYLDDDVKRAIQALVSSGTELRTSTLLPSLAKVAEQRDSQAVLCEILEESGIDFDYPESIPDNAGSPPEDISFSPCVHETLNFFRMHQIRSVSVEELARRLLQIGTGSTVRSLEEQGLLEKSIEQLEEAVSSR
jgi:hypothetical protein